MILQLDIEQIAPEMYEVDCEHQTPPTTLHGSSSAALKHYGESIPADFCRFVEVRYDGVTKGATAVARLAQEPEAMARELMGLSAAFSDTCKDMVSARRASEGAPKKR